MSTIFWLAVAIIFVVTVCAIVKWLCARNGVTIPAPFLYVFWAFIAILALVLLYYVVLSAGIPPPAPLR